jgi:hypothetical protein
MFHDIPDKDNFMVLKCQVCGKAGAHMLVSWSPQTLKEKGPLPASFVLCEEHNPFDAMRHSKAELQKARDSDFHC